MNLEKLFGDSLFQDTSITQGYTTQQTTKDSITYITEYHSRESLYSTISLGLFATVMVGALLYNMIKNRIISK